MSVLGLSSIINGVASAADELFTSDEERLKIALAEKRLGHEQVQSQLAVNQVEASSQSLFVAGWRPAIGWIGAVALAYQFVLYPLLIWLWSLLQAKGTIPIDLEPPPTLPADTLWVILSGMLGIAGIRSFDKVKKVETKTMK